MKKLNLTDSEKTNGVVVSFDVNKFIASMPNGALLIANYELDAVLNELAENGITNIKVPDSVLNYWYCIRK